MQKFILIILALGLGFFLYLLQTGQISKEDFNIRSLQSETSFVVKNVSEDSSIKTSDLYVKIKDKEYKIFTFSGNDFNRPLKAEYALKNYKIPLEASDAIVITSIGNKYIFYIVSLDNKNYDTYKAEYPTDDISKLEYFKIRTIENSELSNKVEVKY